MMKLIVGTAVLAVVFLVAALVMYALEHPDSALGIIIEWLMPTTITLLGAYALGHLILSP